MFLALDPLDQSKCLILFGGVSTFYIESIDGMLALHNLLPVDSLLLLAA
jgi:hypothetical protein